MKEKMKNKIIPVIFINLILMGISFGQNPEDRNEKIQKEIEIYNNILNKLIIKDSPFVFSFDDHVKGVYLDGFGILFDMESSGLYDLSESVLNAVRNIDRIEIVDNKSDTVIKVRTSKREKDDDRVSEGESKSIADKVSQTKKLLMQFYLDYASAVKSLNPDERIVVNIRIHDRNYEYYYRGNKEKAPTQLRASVIAADLTKFRQGKITEAQLIQKIQFTESYDEKSDHEIGIMENILNTALGKSNNKSALALTGGTRGIYLDNYGVLFFSPAGVFDKGMRVLIKNMSNWEQKNRQYEQKTRQYEQKMREYEKKLKEYDNQKERKLIVPPVPPVEPVIPEAPEAPEAPELDIDVDIDWNKEQYLKQEKVEIDSIINSMSNQIVELLGQYSHTMRKVKDNEWIMVAVDFNYRIWDSEASRLYIKVKKSDLLKYNRNEINLDTLKKTVKTWRG